MEAAFFFKTKEEKLKLKMMELKGSQQTWKLSEKNTSENLLKKYFL